MEEYSYLYYSYRENEVTKGNYIRTLHDEEKETVVLKLKILKQKIKHIIRKLTVWKNLIFADLLISFGTVREAYSHCTHLQIARAKTQTKNCKRVCFFANAPLIMRTEI